MSASHKRDIKDLPCVVCGGVQGIDPHHLLHPEHGFNSKGMGRTSADKWLIPLCRTCHTAAHDYKLGDDEAWLASQGVAGREIASALWAERGNIEGMIRVTLRALQAARLKRDSLPPPRLG
jgi:hypothetical protein